MTDKFRVTELAAAKRKRAPRKSKASPVQVTRLNPEAVKLAHELAGDRDVRVEIRMDGTIVIKNGARK
jgi:hypothetical protein